MSNLLQTLVGAPIAPMKKETLQILIDEVKKKVRIPLTDYGAAKLLAFPLGAVAKAYAQYYELRGTGYDKLYALCREATFIENKKPNTEKAQYVIDTMELSFTDGDIVPVAQRRKPRDAKKGRELIERNEQFFEAQLRDKTKEQRERNKIPVSGSSRFADILNGKL